MTAPKPIVHWIVVPAGTRPAQCRSGICRARVFWIKTAKGKDMPVDCSVEGGFEPQGVSDGQGIAHWATCSDTERFRRKT
jgi:hypothetical protein